MNYINTEKLGQDILFEVSLMITPDETIDKINEFVHTAVDFKMTGKEKFEWVVEQVFDMALTVWELVLPLVVQALYEAMMVSMGAKDGK